MIVMVQTFGVVVERRRGLMVRWLWSVTIPLLLMMMMRLPHVRAFASTTRGRPLSLASTVTRGHHPSSLVNGLVVGTPSAFWPNSLASNDRTLVPFLRRTTRQLATASSHNNNNNDDGWQVPAKIYIPEDQLEISFVRSSGAGGQNVNKLSTQVQVRFHVPSATWMPTEVRHRLRQQQANRINKEGFLQLNVQEHRTQSANRRSALHKLQELVRQAWARPKERNLRTGISEKTKRQRKEFKRQRKQVKERRRPVRMDD